MSCIKILKLTMMELFMIFISMEHVYMSNNIEKDCDLLFGIHKKKSTHMNIFINL